MSGKRYVGVRYSSGSISLPGMVVTVYDGKNSYVLQEPPDKKLTRKKRRNQRKVRFDWGRWAHKDDVRLLAKFLLMDMFGKAPGKKKLHEFECRVVRTLPEMEWQFGKKEILEIIKAAKVLEAVASIKG